MLMLCPPWLNKPILSALIPHRQNFFVAIRYGEAFVATTIITIVVFSGLPDYFALAG